MNSDGEIKRFKDGEEAKEAGYQHDLSEEEAEKLKKIEPPNRLPEMIFWAYQRAVLSGRKVDTIEKIKIRNIIKFVLIWQKAMSDHQAEKK